jgi:hypothetical protein
MLEHDSSLNHFLGGLLLGAVVVSLIFQTTRRSTSKQDTSLDPTFDPAVESTDPTLPDSESSSDTDSAYKPLDTFLDQNNYNQYGGRRSKGVNHKSSVPLAY